MGAVISTKRSEVEEGVVLDEVTARFEGQMMIYLSQASHANMTLIYAAANEEENLQKFIEQGKAQNIAVTTKSHLLKPEEFQALPEYQ